MADAQQFTIGWVGDKTFEKDGTTEYSISVKDVGDVEHRKVKLTRPSNAPRPQINEQVKGALTQHEKFADAKRLVEAGADGTVASSPVPASAVQDPNERQISIEAQAAAKSAARFLQGREGVTSQQIHQATAAFFIAIQNAKEEFASDTPPQGATAGAGGGDASNGSAAAGESTDAAKSPDDDIPF